MVLLPVNGAFESLLSSCLWEVSVCGLCCSVHVHATYPAQFSVIYFGMKLFICRKSPQVVTSAVLSPCPYIVWGTFSASVHCCVGPPPAVLYTVIIVNIPINIGTFFTAHDVLTNTQTNLYIFLYLLILYSTRMYWISCCLHTAKISPKLSTLH